MSPQAEVVPVLVSASEEVVSVSQVLPTFPAVITEEILPSIYNLPAQIVLPEETPEEKFGPEISGTQVEVGKVYGVRALHKERYARWGYVSSGFMKFQVTASTPEKVSGIWDVTENHDSLPANKYAFRECLSSKPSKVFVQKIVKTPTGPKVVEVKVSAPKPKRIITGRDGRPSVSRIIQGELDKGQPVEVALAEVLKIYPDYPQEKIIVNYKILKATPIKPKITSEIEGVKS